MPRSTRIRENRVIFSGPYKLSRMADSRNVAFSDFLIYLMFPTAHAHPEQFANFFTRPCRTPFLKGTHIYFWTMTLSIVVLDVRVFESTFSAIPKRN